MNFIITATQESIEEVINAFKGHVTIVAVTQETEYVHMVKELTNNFTHTVEGVVRPVSELRWVQEGLLPKLSLAFAKGAGVIRDFDDITNIERLVPLEHEDYIRAYATDILTNPITKAKVYLFADRVYNGQKPVVFTCTSEEESDLAILETIGRVFNDWFKIYPASIYELDSNRDIMSIQPNPQYKKEVAEFMVGYNEMQKGNVNLD